MKSISAICRKCSKPGIADQFRIDVNLMKMVCPTCYGAQSQKPVKISVPAVKKQKPKDWDEIDEKLQQRAIQKEMATLIVNEIGHTGKTKYTCTKCRYSFRYSVHTDQPQRCPYCNGWVPRMRFA